MSVVLYSISISLEFVLLRIFIMEKYVFCGKVELPYYGGGFGPYAYVFVNLNVEPSKYKRGFEGSEINGVRRILD